MVVNNQSPVHRAVGWCGATSDDGPPAIPPLANTPEDADSLILKGRRVVIVEDEAITQVQLKRICRLAGMQVVGQAADGEGGVQIALAVRPDIILMDVKMPVLDGLSAAERILKELAVCVVMLTAYDLEEYQDRARTIGAYGYVLKPFTAAMLVPKLQAAYKAFLQRAQ